jgi:hypothetical protein
LLSQRFTLLLKITPDAQMQILVVVILPIGKDTQGIMQIQPLRLE